MWDHRAKILEQHDGDSVIVYQDDGRDEFVNLKVRLFGTYAPELKDPGGPETHEFALAWVAERNVGLEWPWIVELIRNKKDTDELETLGRYIGMVKSVKTGEYLNVAVSAFVKARGYGGGIGAVS